MKRVVLLLLTALLLLPACASEKEQISNLPVDYSLAQAKADGCVVYENGSITSGQEIWEKFVEGCEAGKRTSVRLGFYYTLENDERISNELYEQEKDNYPVLFIQDLSYDGHKYTLLERDDEDHSIIHSVQYRFLKRYSGEPSFTDAVFSSYVYYVLLNDDSVTWEQIMYSMVSSSSFDWIDYRTVYQKRS
jgi:hypothetical protein